MKNTILNTDEMNTKQSKTEKVIQFLKDIDNTGIDIAYYYQAGHTFNQFEEAIYQAIAETEVIYYNEAINYLAKNDNSLRDSLNLAHELGYSCDSLNSEILATILKQDILHQEYGEIRSDIEEFFNDIENEDEEE